jgi:hypothetical protein
MCVFIQHRSGVDLHREYERHKMAAVIAFPKQNTKKHEREKFFGPAQVMIFTGVRHERLVDVVEVSARPNRRLPSRRNQATAEELD